MKPYQFSSVQFSCSIIGAPWAPESSPEGFSFETLSVQLFDYTSPWTPESSPEGFSLEALSVSQSSCSIKGTSWTPESSPEGFSLDTLSVSQSVQFFDQRNPLDGTIQPRRLLTSSPISQSVSQSVSQFSCSILGAPRKLESSLRIS